MENFLSLIIAYYVCGYVEVELAAFNAINIEREYMFIQTYHEGDKNHVVDLNLCSTSS